jgi:hypothetical protein
MTSPILTPGFSHPWVYSVTKTDGKITFQVEVTDFKPTAKDIGISGDIEISGQATQVNGAFARISCITNMTDSFKGTGDDKDRDFVNVEATPIGEQSFTEDEDVTVFVQVSKVWVTVLGAGVELGQGSAQGSTERPTWGIHRADAHSSAHGGSS